MIWRHFEHRPGTSIRAAIFSRAVKISIAALHQHGRWITTVGVIERSQGGQDTAGGHTEYGAITISAAFEGRAVKIAVASLHQPGHREHAVVSIECCQTGRSEEHTSE